MRKIAPCDKRPDSSTVPNTASNAKDHGNGNVGMPRGEAFRKVVRDCGGIVCRKVGRIIVYMKAICWRMCHGLYKDVYLKNINN